MKKLFTIVIAILAGVGVYAQAPPEIELPGNNPQYCKCAYKQFAGRHARKYSPGQRIRNGCICGNTDAYH